MKLNSDFFKGRYWQPGLIVGSVFFFVLTAYLGYRLWETSQADLEKLQEIREFKAASANALFFSTKVVTGDSSAIDPLSVTFKSMDEVVGQLQEADAFTRSRLAEEYAKANSLWASVKQNADVAGEIEFAVNLLNAMQGHLSQGAFDAEKFALESVERLTLDGAPSYQVERVRRQAVLMRSMSESLKRFIRERTPSRTNFEKFQTDVRAFEENYNVLMNGRREGNLRALSNTRIRNGLEKINIYIDSVRPSNATGKPFLPSVEKILLARDASQGIKTSFESLQGVLDDMGEAIAEFGNDRFPRLIHVLISAFLFLASVIGFILHQRMTAKEELDKEHEEGQRTQGAILRLLDELVDLADGDLTISATVSEDFTGAIADSINFTIDQLRQLVSRINSTAVQVSQAAQGTQQTALHLAEASDHQAQEIAGASAAINEMAVTIDQVSANASESALVAGKSVSIANNGAKLVQNTIHGMDTIREQIQDTSKRIKRLGESSQEIGDIVSLINDIADQTNILALNAAIQASMAGDAGRGFAVVADEVQRLAERSAAATKQIESLVKAIQTDTNEAVISMEQTTSEVVRGARLAQDAGVALEEIEGVSANLAELIQNISNAARQQASSAGHISNTMNVIQEITSQTSAGTNETADSIGTLASMAFDLRESVAGFTLPAEMLADLEEQEMAGAEAKTSQAAPPMLEGSAVVNDANQNANIDSLVNSMDKAEQNGAGSDDYFELLDNADDDEDLLSEFDVDLSDVVFPDDDTKSAS